MCISMVVILKSEGSKCVKNPFVYGASKMGNVYCSCIQTFQNTQCPAQFEFNETTWYQKPSHC